jgi:hypothetical protein
MKNVLFMEIELVSAQIAKTSFVHESGTHDTSTATSHSLLYVIFREYIDKIYVLTVNLVQAIVDILVIVFINKWFALLHLMAFIVIYIYLGKNCPESEEGGGKITI